MASSDILSKTLLSITNTKLAQLNKQKDAYNNRKRLLIDTANAQSDSNKRVRELVEGIKHLPSMTSSTLNPMLSLDNLNRFVQQAQHDPAVTGSFVEEYESLVRNELQIQSNRYAFASLYGKLVNEWISAGKNQEEGPKAASISVGREEAQVQRATWEEYVFAPKATDKDAIKTYLSTVFEAEEDVKDATSELRENLKRFQDNWSVNPHFNVASLTTTINGMLRSDILTDSKRATLKDFVGNETVLSEIADVLNMRMATREAWTWESDLVIDQRRQLNGRYRFYPDEDLLQSIFLHYIGMRWAVELRSRFEGLLHVWKPSLEPISTHDKRRLQFFLGVSNDFDGEMMRTMEWVKRNHFENEIFLDQLPKYMEEQRGAYGSRDDTETADTRKSHIDVVQQLLHMIEADILLQNRFDKKVTVIRSDFKWFGPSIPHSSIVAVLEFFGVGADWLDFFIKVLEAPLRFKQDPEDAPSRTRKRGTPLSTPLADVFGESLLFCVDFAVNQMADGARLYRLHDDMWLWGDTEACVKSWGVLKECASVLGLDFNLEKTGSASNLGIDKELAPSDLDTGLPHGDVSWGFLKLDRLTGRFIINQDEVDKHIEELRLQLDACKTVFNWIQAWNTYGARFFSNFFGKPANCSSRQHIDSMLETFQRIQQKLFPDTPGGVGAHLKQMVAERFDIPLSEIPDGYIYFPPEFGGLGLKNPFINLCLVRDAVVEDPERIIDSFFEQEAREYRRTKADFESDAMSSRRLDMRFQFQDLENEDFMSLEEFSRYRERLSVSLGCTFKQLMQEPSPKTVELKGTIKAVLDPAQWRALTSYDQWIVQLFNKDMIARFGGLNVVEKGLLPTGLMDMLRQSKFQWVG